MSAYKFWKLTLIMTGLGFMAAGFLQAATLRFIAGEYDSAFLDAFCYGSFSFLFWDGFLTSTGIFPLRAPAVRL